MRAKNHINSFLIEHGTHISHLQISIREKKKQNWGSSSLIHDQLRFISIVSRKKEKIFSWTFVNWQGIYFSLNKSLGSTFTIKAMGIVYYIYSYPNNSDFRNKKLAFEMISYKFQYLMNMNVYLEHNKWLQVFINF